MTKQLQLLAKNWAMALLYPKPLVGLAQLPRFVAHWFQYAFTPGAQRIGVLDTQPCLGDWCQHTPFDPHYFYQGAWLARKVDKSAAHVDIGSSVLTMSVLSACVNVVFVDYRPLKVSLPGLRSVAGDILRLPFADNALYSLSCLHVIEHIGLGRYGDRIDPQGSVKAASELQRTIKPGGKLFLSLPIGRERVCFNAHRVYAPSSVVKMFEQLKLIEFSYVDDAGQLREDEKPSSASELNYGCGLFMFEKP
jgi:hypothetical protein